MLTTIAAGTASAFATLPRDGGVLSLFNVTARLVAGWAQRRRQLRTLSELAEHLLRDVGLSPDDVERACCQTFWMR
jgi:uncharacterized protein YjiS (DUF1127 family)